MAETIERRNGNGRRSTDGYCPAHHFVCQDYHEFKDELRKDVRSKAPLWIVIPMIGAVLTFAAWYTLNVHEIDNKLSVIAERQANISANQEKILHAMGIFPRHDSDYKY